MPYSASFPEPIVDGENALSKATTTPSHVDALDAFHKKYSEDDEGRALRRLRRRKAKLSQILLTVRMVAAESAVAQRRRSKWKLANAGPIGLLGFGMTTVLLNLHNAGYWPLMTPIPAMGICFGGIAQFVAGLFEFARGNTFGCVAFISYGSFWLSLICVWMLPTSTIALPSEVEATSAYFTGIYLCLWGIFSLMMMICTLRMNLVIFLIFLSVTLLFFLLGGADMAGNKDAVRAAGYEGIVCGCLALYLGFAEVVNEVWDRTILPVIPMTQLLGWFGYSEDEGKKE